VSAHFWLEEFDKFEKLRDKEKVTGIDCYDLEPKGLSNKTTLVLSNTRELDGVLSTK